MNMRTTLFGLMTVVCGLAPPALSQCSVTQRGKLNGSGVDTYDYFGLALSVDGKTLAAGDPTSTAETGGVVFMFEWDGQVWTETAVVSANDTDSGDRLGGAVSLREESLWIGSPGIDGAVYWFERVGGIWKQRFKYSPTSNYLFGSSIDQDDARAVVGSKSESGLAWVFQRTDSSYELEAVLAPSGSQGSDLVGAAVVLDGDWIALGAPYHDALGPNSGAVFLYHWDGSAWVQHQKLLASNGTAFDTFGSSLALDRKLLIVGAPFDEDRQDAGAAYVFQLVDGLWTETARLQSTQPEPYAYFGYSVGLDQSIVAIGAPGATGNTALSGRVELFAYDGSAWLPGDEAVPFDGEAQDYFGQGVTVQGRHLIVGAPRDDDQGMEAGALYAFDAACLPIYFGESYCFPAILNSSGKSGTIRAFGSPYVVDNDVELQAENLPSSQFGYFLNGREKDYVPFVGQGILCLGGGIGRYSAQVGSTGATGELRIQLDLTATPTPTGPVAVLPGETWMFQCWFRDTNPQPTSNLTDAIEILFL